MSVSLRLWMAVIGLGAAGLTGVAIYPWSWYIGRVAIIALCGAWLMSQLVIPSHKRKGVASTTARKEVTDMNRDTQWGK